MPPTKTSRNNSCFVPNCTSGYKSSDVKVSLFKPPNDPKRLNDWERNIKRGDKKLTKNCVVCSLHFEKCFIEHSFKHTINGKIVEIPREKPKLTDDAVPTRFPDAPAYFNKRMPVKRKQRNLCDQAPPTKRSKICRNTPVDMVNNMQNDTHENYDNIAGADNAVSLYNLLELPKMWSCFYVLDLPNTLHYGCCKFRSAEDYSVLTLSKLVQVVQQLDGSAICKTFLRGIVESTTTIKTPEELKELLMRADKLILCAGCRIKPSGKVQYLEFNGAYYSKNCMLICKEEVCLHCKYLLRLIRQQKTRKSLQTKIHECKLKKKRYTAAKTLKTKRELQKVQQTVKQMKLKNERALQEGVVNNLSKLPIKQRMMVETCFKSASRKATNGMTYEKEWILECILIRMRSPKLYKYLRTHQLLVLPGDTCLRKYLDGYKSGFGFNPRIFSALSIKTQEMDIFARHGGLLFDEIKLSEHLTVQANGFIEGFVDLGQFTSESNKREMCDHGFVVMFQPFEGQWTQILGVFASKSNVKAEILTKIIIEATVLSEQSGLFVDFVTCDGASWNRSMWKQFGISGSAGAVRCNCAHPVDPCRKLHFISDFPHLIKCLHNSLTTTEFTTPEGLVSINHIKAAWERDSKSLTLKVMPHITSAHIDPINFEKMRVNLAFKLFSEEVLKGLFLYKEDVEQFYGDISCTESFVKRLQKLIYIMTSRTPINGLQNNSQHAKFLRDFIDYLDQWDKFSKNCRNFKDKKIGFISKATAEGFRVTLESVLALTEYLSSKVNYTFLLTAQLSQDKIENLFGIIHQSSGTNDHPTPEQFLLTVNCLSFYNLAKPPKSGNCAPGLIDSLVNIPNDCLKKGDKLAKAIDKLLDLGSIEEAEEMISANSEALDHAGYSNQRSDSRLIFYISGYVARKHLKSHHCLECAQVLTDSPFNSITNPDASFTIKFDHGGLVYPSSSLLKLITTLETHFTMFFSNGELYAQSMMDFLDYFNMFSSKTFVGCEKHKHKVTANIIKFYILVRFHFYTKCVNENRSTVKEKQKYLKLRRCK